MEKLKKFVITLIFIIGIALLFQINNTYAKTAYITNSELSYVTLENGETLISGFEIGEKVSNVLKSFSMDYSVKIKNNQGKDITSELETKVGTGYKIELYNGELLEKTFTTVIYGDTNGDGETGAVDALVIIKNKLGVEKLKNKATEESGRVSISTRTSETIPMSNDALYVIKHKLYSEQYPIEQKIMKTTEEDYNAPTISNVQTNVDGFKIIVTATIADTASLNAEAGISGINLIEYSIDGENYQESNEFTIETPGNYTVYVRAIDKAENEKIETSSVIVKGYTLTLNKNPEAGGTVSGNGEKIEGQSCTVTAKANSGYKFTGWYEDNNKVSTDTTYEFEMPAKNYTLEARFVQLFTVTVIKGEGIKEATGSGTVENGNSQIITATLNEGYEFVEWKVTSGSGKFGNKNQLTTTITPESDVTVQATAKKITTDNTTGTTNKQYIPTEPASPQNPVIPVGFKTVDTTTAKWGEEDAWNHGLVIADGSGNEFVWVPVDGSSVKYEKWCTQGIEWNNSSISNDILPSGVSDEIYQITKYNGFYIARYEAGIPADLKSAINPSDTSWSGMQVARSVSGIPVSKKNQVPWNWIDYTNAKANAEKMYNNTNVQSGLLTGTMWDTTLRWLISTNVITEYAATSDSKTWGNYYNAPVTKVTEYSEDDGATWLKTNSQTKGTGWKDTWVLKTGHSDYTKRNNIYDLAGNLWEWTNEKYSSYHVGRGGGYNESYVINGHYTPAAYRSYLNYANGIRQSGYRVALYIK